MTGIKLTPKQSRFIDEYLIDLNGTQAAIRAGYSVKVAREQAKENLTKPYIKDEVDKQIKDRQNRTQVTQDMVIEELKKVGFSDITNYIKYNKEGIEIIGTSSIDKEYTSVISSASETITKDGKRSLQFKLHDKIKSLELLGRHLAMFTDKHDLSSKDGSMTPTVLEIPINEWSKKK